MPGATGFPAVVVASQVMVPVGDTAAKARIIRPVISKIFIAAFGIVFLADNLDINITGLLAGLFKLIAKGGKAIIILIVGALAALRKILASIFSTEVKA